MRLEAEREAVADACRRLAAERLVIGTAGNVSVRAEDLVVTSPSGGVFAKLDPEDMTVVGLDGEVVEGDRAPTSELGLHLALYGREEGCGAVVHTHAPMATALSCVLDELPAVHYQMLSFGGPVRVAPYATFGTAELHDKVIAALQGRTAALMRNHGAIAWAGDADGAVELSLLLEWACTLYWRARAIGAPSTLDEDDLAEVIEQVRRTGYGGGG